MMDGIINIDSDFAKELGFTSEFFSPASYLWRSGNAIIVSFIESSVKGVGSFSRLVQTIEARGHIVQVPTPLARMEAILQHWGFVSRVTDDGVELWSRPMTAEETNGKDA